MLIENEKYRTMKKTILLFMVLIGALTMQAGDTYPYLTFETTDGAKASVSTSSLTLSIIGTTLTAGDRQFTLSNLKKMYFSTADETTSEPNSIDNGQFFDERSGKAERTTGNFTDIYDLQGHKVSKKQMRKGIYFVKTKDNTYKIVVR
jgi:hypothetical protein